MKKGAGGGLFYNPAILGGAGPGILPGNGANFPFSMSATLTTQPCRRSDG